MSEVKEYNSVTEIILKKRDEAFRFIDQDGRVFVKASFKDENGEKTFITVEIKKHNFE